jgi:hypothetical protein
MQNRDTWTPNTYMIDFPPPSKVISQVTPLQSSYLVCTSLATNRQVKRVGSVSAILVYNCGREEVRLFTPTTRPSSGATSFEHSVATLPRHNIAPPCSTATQPPPPTTQHIHTQNKRREHENT